MVQFLLLPPPPPRVTLGTKSALGPCGPGVGNFENRLVPGVGVRVRVRVNIYLGRVAHSALDWYP